MEELKEKQDITNKLNLLMILLLTISIIAISSFIVFFIGVTRVDALDYMADIPQDGKPYYIGTRSQGVITNKSVSAVNYNDSVPSWSYYYVNGVNTKYLSIGFSYNVRPNRVYKITIYYSDKSRTKYFSNYAGICVGYNSDCNTGDQTINATYLGRVFPNTNNPISMARLSDANGIYTTPQIIEDTFSARKGEMTFKANNNGQIIALYLEANDTIQDFYLYGAKIEDLGLSEDLLRSYVETSTNTITGSISALSTELKNKIDSAIASINSATTTTINNSTTTITNNQNNNTQQQIENNNYNTQQQIDNYNESQKRCAEGITDLSGTLSVSQKYLMNNGTLRAHSNFDVSDYIEVNPNTQYEIDIDPPFTESQWASFCQYNENKQLISCTQYGTNREQNFTTTANTKYMLFSFIRDGSQNMMLKGYTCTVINDEDLSAGDKRPVNNSGVEGYIDSENTLKSQMNTNSLNSVDIDIDLDSNNWIWTTMTAFLNTNTVIMTMVISILSIGVIKLVLTR